MARTPQRIPPANPPREEVDDQSADGPKERIEAPPENELAGLGAAEDLGDDVEEDEEFEAAPEPFDALEENREIRAAMASRTTEDPLDPAKGWLPPGFVRQPFGEQVLKLDAPKRRGFHRHWFNDWPGRIESALKAGYKHVEKNGRPISKTVGTSAQGGGLIAYYMEIPLEFYLQDMRAQQAVNDATEQAIRGGTVREKAGDNRYVPKGGISVGKI